MEDNTKTIYFISDVHGHFKEMTEALRNAGFDEENPNDLLVCLGDIFDRGNKNIEVYQYLKRLSDEGKAIVTTGNHHKFLIEFLEGSINAFNYLHNGLDTTIADFWNRTRPFESWCLLEGNCEINQDNYARWCEICRNDINEEYPELLPWLKSLPRYFESEHYIGVHGAIDTEVQDWHFPHCAKYSLTDWDALEFDDGSFFNKSICNTDKTIVIGHFGTYHLRDMYNLNRVYTTPVVSVEEADRRQLEKFSVLKRPDGRVIAIDGTTIVSGKVNVLVIKNERLI